MISRTFHRLIRRASCILHDPLDCNSFILLPHLFRLHTCIYALHQAMRHNYLNIWQEFTCCMLHTIFMQSASEPHFLSQPVLRSLVPSFPFSIFQSVFCFPFFFYFSPPLFFISNGATGFGFSRGFGDLKYHSSKMMSSSSCLAMHHFFLAASFFPTIVLYFRSVLCILIAPNAVRDVLCSYRVPR